jgi:hypothetical protein
VHVIRARPDAGCTSLAIYAEPAGLALHVKMPTRPTRSAGTPGRVGPGHRQGKRRGQAVRCRRPTPATASSSTTTISPRSSELRLIWIRFAPQSIRDRGDKAVTRQIAGAPLVAGIRDTVSAADEVVAFAEEQSTHQSAVGRAAPSGRERPLTTSGYLLRKNGGPFIPYDRQ